MRKSGSFDLWMHVRHGNEKRIMHASFYVEPLPSLRDSALPPASIMMQTVLTKCMGSLDTWTRRLAETSESGYNVVHFTPVQPLGLSNSAYSLLDQRGFADTLGGDAATRRQRLESVIAELEQACGMISLVDVVYNHTACNCPWLAEHPEAAYSMETAPHLRAAAELDTALMNYSLELIESGRNVCDGEVWLDEILTEIRTRVIPDLRLHEFYVFGDRSNIRERFVAEFELYASSLESISEGDAGGASMADLLLRGEAVAAVVPDATRNRRHINVAACASIVYNQMYGSLYSRAEVRLSLDDACNALFAALDELEARALRQYNDDVDHIVNNLRSTIRYDFLDEHGPKRSPFSAEHGLLAPYFTRVTADSTRMKHVLANNGWLFGGGVDDITRAERRAYFLRDVVIWGDSVKLRYGEAERDSPWLWQHMRAYTREMATLFKGFRIDNCHGTPLHVAQSMIDEARRVRSELVVVAELFTGSIELDLHYVRSLGLTALVREAMQPESCDELARLCHRHSSEVRVGSLRLRESGDVTRLRPVLPRALFTDCTHDNEAMLQRRKGADTLSTAALVSFGACATASTMGFDWVVPRHVHVVRETRLYSIAEKRLVRGITGIRSLLNRLHAHMDAHNYEEAYVHQHEALISVQRHCPHTLQSFILVAHTAFSRDSTLCARSLDIEGNSPQILLAATLHVSGDEESRARADRAENIEGVPSSVHAFVSDELRTLLGDKEVLGHVEATHADAARLCTLSDVGAGTGRLHRHRLEFGELFAPGSIVILSTKVDEEAAANLRDADQHFNETRRGLGTDAYEALRAATLLDLNLLLYRVDAEERAESSGRRGVYNVPGHGPLVYAGVRGATAVLERVRRTDDTGSALAQNVRNGQWLLEYTADRIEQNERLSALVDWLRRWIVVARALPPYLQPKLVDRVLGTLDAAATLHMARLMGLVDSNDVLRTDGSDRASLRAFKLALAHGSVQMYGALRSAPLIVNTVGDEVKWASMAAGLPHFSSGYMRSWGRDTFIALRGLFLRTRRYKEALALIVGFARSMRHGLIPNLLNGGAGARFNARDAVWFWLKSVQDYAACDEHPGGLSSLLATKIGLVFSTDDAEAYTDADGFGSVSTLGDLIQEVLQRHASGIQYRERNAGTKIDSRMTSDGFNVEIHVDASTGFVHGGNRHNCGTWMDKMGESARAKNVGVPATPRDGAAIELVALCKATVRWLATLHRSGQFAHAGVRLADGSLLSYADWDARIQNAFEKHFWVPIGAHSDVNVYDTYKDTVGSSHGFTDYQLRPNQLVAMVEAPELFSANYARRALLTVERRLVSVLGVRTLDAHDWQYRGDYENSADSDDFGSARGFNYHQGPEWLWPFGYFVHACAHFNPRQETARRLRARLYAMIEPHRQYLERNDDAYFGLPELTNANGARCEQGCESQAWSMATLLDAAFVLERLDAKTKEEETTK